ncbi:hypothetical protein QOZ80_7BG0583590 [Eleusine coracana subsp. coracana]|nr:hypothetical protein QOZ80_7BG0583590 [Eleusine coracana subsp. coracana]
MGAATLFLCSSISVLIFFPLVVAQFQGVDLCETKANGRYVCPDCSVKSSSNRGASFDANLLRLRDSLRDMVAANASFLNAAFSGGDAEDTVYGLAMCLADAERADCAACLAGAADELPATRCASHRDMVLWYPQCLVRYDNASFFGVADTSPARRFVVPNPNNFSVPARLDASRRRLAGRMLAAAAAASPARFEFDVEEVTSNVTLHGLAQCTQDLPVQECNRCLASHMAWLAGCCGDMEGVRLNGPSCYLRYEFMSFMPGTPPSMAPLIEPPAAGTSSSSSRRKKTRTYILAGALGAVALLVSLLGLGVAFLCYKKRHWPWRRRGSNNNNAKRMDSFLQHHHPRRYSYSQVKRMTKSFAHKLGQGGNGVVYRGNLPDGGRDVAVKMLKEAKIAGEEFMNEVASISRTSHVNVVTLLGFCLQGSKVGLIYEYMPNGSLERYIPGHGEEGTLSWEKLFDIAVGTARGLEYLHRGCNAHIVHFDIKPHNILLDLDFRPKISDFGLAKLCAQKESTIQVSIVGFRGTIGYIAPEVVSRHVGAVTSKSDVHSYGMMVFAMVGATSSINDDSDSGASSKYFPQFLYEDLDQFCATTCGVDVEATGLVRKMVIIGLWCIQRNPSDRPSMSRVVEMLEKRTEELQLPPQAS